MVAQFYRQAFDSRICHNGNFAIMALEELRKKPFPEIDLLLGLAGYSTSI